MCNHGHSISLRSENLYARYRFLSDQGVTPVSGADLMARPDAHGLPDPLTPILGARVGERVRIRLLS